MRKTIVVSVFVFAALVAISAFAQGQELGTQELALRDVRNNIRTLEQRIEICALKAERALTPEWRSVYLADKRAAELDLERNKKYLRILSSPLGEVNPSAVAKSSEAEKKDNRSDLQDQFPDNPRDDFLLRGGKRNGGAPANPPPKKMIRVVDGGINVPQEGPVIIPPEIRISQ